MKIDLYLGSDLGAWVLDEISAENVNHIITLDKQLAQRAAEKGMRVIVGNANNKQFAPAAIGFSVHYPRLIRQPLLSQYQKIYNLHPGYLPWGRGYYPVFWAMWEDTPAGATLHEMVEDVDAGDIVAQAKVAQQVDDTGYTLFQRVRQAEKGIFQTYFPRMVQGEVFPTLAQSADVGTYHAKKEFFELKSPQNWRSMSAEKLAKLTRCLSFPGYTGLELTLDGQRFSFVAEPIE